MSGTLVIGGVTLRALDATGREDQYSDGDVEFDLLSAFRRGESEESILQRDTRWPVLYHLSPVRRNLLEWFPFSREDRVLEVGAGCGALTGLLCERTRHVTAVELTWTRARIIAHRHARFSNLEVLVGNVEALPEDATGFSCITLVGVLEYARRFLGQPEPEKRLLGLLRGRLAPNGRFLIAIENRLGLKYWAGSREDHTGRHFDGLEGYPGRRDVATFGRRELAALLTGAGFADLAFYYPHPDYKLPETIFSDSCLPAAGELSGATPAYDRDRIELFEEPAVADQLLANGLFGDFANSFLVVAGCGREAA